MNTPAARLIENEAIFRKYNEKVRSGFDDLKKLAADDGNDDVTEGIDRMDFQFFCECSDENCKERITMKMSEYSAIHKNRNRFIVLPGHQVVAVEKVIKKKSSYTEVEKYRNPPSNPDTLHKTDVQNV